jgi:hypothetical protein
MITKAALRGYLLEEVLAFLLRQSGYKPIFDPPPDDPDLKTGPHGLLVTGRGADHQADVLGELTWMPSFTYPTRLFVEAKFRSSRTGVSTVRGLIGTLLDLSQNHLTLAYRAVGGNPSLVPRFHYVGVLFSASGFSRPAQDLALAHGLSLVDLRQQAFQGLLDCISELVERVHPEFRVPLPARSAALRSLKASLRRNLWAGTDVAWLTGDAHADFDPTLFDTSRLAEESKRTQGTHIGMSRGPFMLFLKADNDNAFLDFCRDRPIHKVWIRWNDERSDWWITPSGLDHNRYSLRFKLPALLAQWIASQANTDAAALDAKRRYFKSITIYHRSDDREEIFRLQFDEIGLLEHLAPPAGHEVLLPPA